MQPIRITMFGGIIPRIADRGLPDNAAQYAMNAKLTSGELRSWNGLRVLAALAEPNSKTTYHYRHNGLDRYIGFPVVTSVVKAPLINEQLGRLYWTNELGAFVNTAARIEGGQPAFGLGVAGPTYTHRVITGLGSGNMVTRVYVATVVSTFGEESAPGPAVSVSGRVDGAWDVYDLHYVAAAAPANTAYVRLYRTVDGSTGTDYRLVKEFPVATTPALHPDTVTDVDAADNPPLQTIGWGRPIAGLRGLIAVPGGAMAGFKGRTVYFSVPYYPHAWPEDYAYAVEDEIVALASFGNTVAVLTQGRAALLVGPSPDSMTMIAMDGVQPCLSAQSVVTTMGGVLYASTDGLIAVDGSSNTGSIVSKGWVTKDEWLSQFSPRSQMSAVYQDRYLTFYTDRLGFVVGFDDPITGYSELQLDGVTSVDMDALTGQTLITRGNTVYEWDGDPSSRLEYIWRSKPFLLPKPGNYGALQVRGTFFGDGVQPPEIPPSPLGGRYIGANPIGWRNTPSPFGWSVGWPAPWTITGEAPPVGAESKVRVKLIVDGRERWVGFVEGESPVRLPSGFKGARYEVELAGSSDIFSLAMAINKLALENLQ